MSATPRLTPEQPERNPPPLSARAWLIKTFTRYLSPAYKYKKELRARWGRYHDIYRSPSICANLFLLTKPAKPNATLDDATWRDLDMDKLFANVDNTVTVLGQQYLYRQIRTYNKNADELASQFQTALCFQRDDNFREQTQLHLMGLRGSNASQLSTMLYGATPDGAFPKPLAIILSATSVISIGIALVTPALLWLPLLPLLINFSFSESYADNIGRHTLSFTYLKKMLLVAQRITDVSDTTPIKQSAYLRSTKNQTRLLSTKFRLCGLDSTSGNIAIAQIAFLLNILCLFDYLVYMRASNSLARHKQELSSIFDALASMDSAIAVASYIQANPDYCNPEFADASTIKFYGVTHPLLDNAVPNDFCSENQSALITGSNMAGKSTFIKTIGCNLILAQTLWVCHAQSATVPFAPVLSSIKHSDSIEDGKSYYFAEIEALKRLVGAAASNDTYVFLIDEILRGTNTIERVASSAAILDHLGKRNTLLVTSHDVELTDLLPTSFTLLHFSETADLDNMFDYKVRQGPCTSRNAIALLEAIGFPEQIIGGAKVNAVKLESNNDSPTHML